MPGVLISLGIYGFVYGICSALGWPPRRSRR